MSFPLYLLYVNYLLPLPYSIKIKSYSNKFSKSISLFTQFNENYIIIELHK